MPVGFKWFVAGLFDGSFGFGGEESAGASFLRRDGTVWTTDKDGIILGLLAAEITAVTGKDPGEHYPELAGNSAPTTPASMPRPPRAEETLSNLSPGSVKAAELAGEPITAKLTKAPRQQRPHRRPQSRHRNGWFAARPSGTENIYKIYAESFTRRRHISIKS